MKRILALVLASVLLTCSAAVAAFHTAGSDSYPAVAGFRLNLNNLTPLPPLEDFYVAVSGPATVNRAAPTAGVITTELIVLSLTSHHPITVTVRTTPDSTGEIQLGSPPFPATSFFDVFFDIAYTPPGQSTKHYITQQAIRITNPNHTNVKGLHNTWTQQAVPAEIDLFDRDAAVPPGPVVGTISNVWYSPGKTGTMRKLGLSLNGSNGLDTITKVEYKIAPTGSAVPNNKPGALVDVTELWVVDLASNPDCDEVFGDLGLTVTYDRLQMEAKVKRDVIPPHWDGYHKGSVEIWAMSGATKVLLVAKGSLKGSSGVGTHREHLGTAHDTEECMDASHFEGYMEFKILQGRFARRDSTGKLLASTAVKATYAGVYGSGTSSWTPIATDPPPAKPPSGAFRMTVDGVAVMKPDLPETSMSLVGGSVGGGTTTPP